MLIFDEEKTGEFIWYWFAEVDKKEKVVRSSQWLDWVIDKLKDYPALCDEDIAYNNSWSKEDKDKFFLISYFHGHLISIAESLNISYVDKDVMFETYETNFIYKEKPYHIFTMVGQGAVTSIKNGFEDLDKFPPITIDSYYSNN